MTPSFIAPRARFLQACRVESVDRPPIWMMRQAGRSLPEYRALKEGRSFTELVQDPALAAEISLQPIRRFGYDAAIVFSDILVIAQALGAPYELRESGGIRIDFDPFRPLPSSLSENPAPYTVEAIALLRKELGAERALIGFAGAPWTLASFMLEGGSSPDNLRSRCFPAEHPKRFAELMEKIVEQTIYYLRAQMEAGADALQLFDSQGGTLPPHLYWDCSGRWIKQIIQALPPAVPLLLFARNVHPQSARLAELGARVLSVSHTMDLRAYADSIPGSIAVQGNLDPALLLASPEVAAAQTRRILETMEGRNGFIFNLGHGVPANARLETIEAVVRTVQSFKNGGEG